MDDWSVRANAHRMIEGTWIGTTDFRETSELTDDDSDEEVGKELIEAGAVDIVVGDLFDDQDLESAIINCDQVIHICESLL